MSDLDVRAGLVQEANAQHRLTMEVNKVTFDDPVLLDPTVVDFNHPTKRNSRTVIRAGIFDGPNVAVTMDFNRLALEKAFQFRSTVFDDDQRGGVHDLLDLLTERLGTSVTEEDLIDHPINRSESPATALLEAKPSSMKFFGSYTVSLYSPPV